MAEAPFRPPHKRNKGCRAAGLQFGVLTIPQRNETEVFGESLREGEHLAIAVIVGVAGIWCFQHLAIAVASAIPEGLKACNPLPCWRAGYGCLKELVRLERQDDPCFEP